MIGTVATIARYPVKSMLGETLESASFTIRGMVGDRAFGVIDRSDGLVASAKQPRKWARLLELQASYVDDPHGDVLPPVRIDFPDGSQVTSDATGCDDTLSTFVGRDVTLASSAPDDRRFEEVWPDIAGLAPQEFIASTATSHEESGEAVSELGLGLASPPGTFFDLSVVHVLTTSTLRALGQVAPDSTFDWRRYRPNLLIDTTDAGFVENDWPGHQLSIADSAFNVSMATMRCVMTTLPHGDLPLDRSTLQAIAANNRVLIPGLGTWACTGVYADVATPGIVHIGDEVSMPH